MNRRQWLKGMIFGAAALGSRPLWAQFAPPAPATGLAAELAKLETAHGGKLGVAVLDAHGQRRVSYHGEHRFLLLGISKVLLVADVLARDDTGADSLSRQVIFGSDQLLSDAPVTERHVGPPGMTLEALCKAAIEHGDNTASNLLLQSVGGPPAMTSWLRSIGDVRTEVDRPEPLSRRRQGYKDTTTPDALLDDLRRVTLGQVLYAPARKRLLGWLRAATGGTDGLRKDWPAAWHAGGVAGANRSANAVVAMAWPAPNKALLAAGWYVNPDLTDAQRQAVLAQAGRLIVAWQNHRGT